MGTISDAVTKSYLLGLAFVFLLPAQISADYSTDVTLLEYSELSCGGKINRKAVMLVDLQALLNDKTAAVSKVNERFPDHDLESPVPVIAEQVHWNGGATRKSLLQNAAREAASRGCDLLIILDVDVLEKIMIRPPYMDLKLPVSYVLLLFGSQIRNSARVSKY